MPKSKANVSSGDETYKETANGKGISRNNENIPDYEKQRLKRIEENRSRMEALGLHKIAKSFVGSVQKAQKNKKDKKGKGKIADEDEEYNPTDDENEMSASEEEDDEKDEDFTGSHRKGKKKASTPKKRAPVQKPTFDSDFVDDDEALMKAIALSLQDSAGFLDVKSNSSDRNTDTSKAPATHIPDKTNDESKENLYIQDDNSGKRKRKKSFTSRVQMSEDEMLIHFFQFDETGRGGFTFRDIRRLSVAHDFAWSEKEMADMISYFDSDGDGKINFNDFRKIVGRCNMLKASDTG